MSKYDVFELVTHLRKCPEAYLQSSDFFSTEGVNSIALVQDTYRLVTNDFLRNDFNISSNLGTIDDNHWRAIHISTWLLSNPDFINNPVIEDKLYSFWFIELHKASAYVKCNEWINDDERAEEMVRLLLYCCEIIPFGENQDEAADKLSSLSSVERHKVLKQSYEAHERIMKIKREMEEQKAREAANTYGRE
ncbi:hypothetical protein SAMN05444397_11537 [Flavobacterium aquidurense]|uniref:Uncharacterized protein n=1 Tax=Flavobacterium frigidimaris TaxID=262320 RepID=A0ABX4BKU1_FLAFR|nr:hypothetical protein [Flavobacterium frigidimaris]OXA75690.1 hypothetical protein B0A65_20925 [Flavobacterium frigidimaris]SDZ65749.1 hypothetical protein SAMN05444397_11537 [Flavobacterium aquidurense]